MVLSDSFTLFTMVNKLELHFSVDESEVVTCYYDDFAGSCHLFIRYYTGLPNAIRLRASGNCECHPTRSVANSFRLSVSISLRTASLVTDTGEIRRIKLGDEIEFLDAPEPDEAKEYDSKSHFLSQDGTRWASVYYGNDKAQIQLRTVLNPNEPPRCLELQQKLSLVGGWSTFVAMSMDLSVLVLGQYMYRVEDSKIGEASTFPQALKLELPSELVTEGGKETHPASCSVDSSNSYVAYVKPNRCDNKLPTCPDVLTLLCVNAGESSSRRVQLSLAEDLFDVSCQFHPSLPVLVVGFGLISETVAPNLASNDSREEIRIPYHFVIINLITMSKSTAKRGRYRASYVVDRSETR